MTQHTRFPDRVTAHLLKRAEAVIPANRREWLAAMRAEAAAVPSGGRRVVFAWGCYMAALRLWITVGRGEPVARLLLGLMLLSWMGAKFRFFWLLPIDRAALGDGIWALNQGLALSYGLIAIAVLSRRLRLIVTATALHLLLNTALYLGIVLGAGAPTRAALALAIEDYFVTMMAVTGLLLLAFWRQLTDRLGLIGQ